VNEFLRQIRLCLDAKITALHKEIYSNLLAGNSGNAQWSAQRIACLEELEREILDIYKRLQSA
jgi:hypothetical protein